MVNTRLEGVLRHLRRAVRCADEHDSDARLLERYLRQRDEMAFERLVLRHGPMVLGVCRRILGNEHDAEDAFQAVFLVLVRKAASIRRRRALGAWLYGVAYRTALEARGARAKRRVKEAKVVPRIETPVEAANDVREVLDRELAALPQRYRAAVILCDLEGKSRKEAAQELGCKEGTVASRLARGWSLLAKRLARCGLMTGAAMAIAREAVPAALASSTVQAALYGARRGAGGVVSAKVASLVERMVRIMLVAKIRNLTTWVVLVGVTGLGAGWIYFHQAVAQQPVATNGAPVQVGKEDPSEQAKLRQEMKLLQADLQRALDRVAALETRMKDREEKRSEVLYRGKPASYWVQSLQDRDPDYRRQAVNALGSIAKVDRTVVPILARTMNDEDEGVAREASLKLGRLGEAALPYFKDALKGRNRRVRGFVLEAIRFTLQEKGAALVPTLQDIIKTSEGEQRTQTIETLAFIGRGAKAAVPDLLELLKGSDEEVRVAAFALGGIGPDAKAAVPTLIDFLKQPNATKRYAATVALGKIGPEAKEAVPALIPLLKNRHSIDCWNAAVALGQIGPDAKAALPTLLDILRDPGQGVPDSVKDAIKKIDPKEAAK